MQALVEMIIGAVLFVAALALSQFGVETRSPPEPEREVHRTDCHTSQAKAFFVTDNSRDC